MLSFILFIILAHFFGYFATQNTQPTTITFFSYTTSDVPLYIVIGIALLLGLLLSWMNALIDSIFTSMEIRGKENSIKNSKQTIHELTKQVNALEIENAKLKGKLEKDVLQEETL